MKYIISFFLTLSYFQIFSQNVIINYDFEDGMPICDYTPSDFKKYSDLVDFCKRWQSIYKPANVKIGTFCSSPDYFSEKCADNNGNFQVNGSNAIHKLPQSNNLNNKFASFVGSTDYNEAIILPFNKKMKHQFGVYYTLSFDYAVDDFHGNALSDYELQVYLSKWEEHWESSSSNNVLHEILDPKLTLTKNSTSTWQRVSIVFQLPLGINNADINSQLNHLIIKAKRTKLRYIYIDNVELLEFNPCESICRPKNFNKSISLLNLVPNSATSTGFFHKPVNNSAILANFDPGAREDFKLLMTNAMYYKVEIFDSWGGLQYVYESHDNNMLKDLNNPFKPDTTVFRWWGTSQSGVPLSNAGDVNDYIIKIRARNCFHDINVGTSLAFMHLTNTENFTSIRPPNFDWKLDNCCPDNLVVDNHIYDTDVREVRDNYIHAALNGNVSVIDNTRVVYSAGKEVVIGAGFKVEQGSKLEIKIQPCELNPRNGWKINPVTTRDFDFFHREEILLENIEDDLKIDTYLIYPNPSSDYLHIVVPTSDSKYAFYDFTGRLLQFDYLSEGTNKIDISRFRKGTYIIIIDNLYVQKIIKI